MKAYTTEKIKNIAVLGHGSAGKTTLCEALIYLGGNSEKIGDVAAKNSLLDFDAEEKKRGCSTNTAVFAMEYNNIKINLLDAPGQFDFAAGVTEAVNAADTAIIALSGKSGLNVGSELNLEICEKKGIPVAFFVGKLNSPRAHFYMVMSQLTGKYGSKICPITVPFVENDEVKCFVNLIENKAYTFSDKQKTETQMPQSADIENLRTVLFEAAAVSDEVLMEKYFEGEEITPEELKTAIKKGIEEREIYPVFAGINQTGEGISLLLDALCDIFPSAADIVYKTENGEIKADTGKPAAAYVFKTVADPFVGKLSYFKVVSGAIKSGDTCFIGKDKKEEKIGKIMFIKGAKQEDCDVAVAGDIACISKSANLKTGDTFGARENNEIFVLQPFKLPTLSSAVFADKKGEEEKINQGILRLCEEDPTLSFKIDRETKETVISGLGEQHLDIVKSKLKNKFGVDIILKQPKVPYRETISKKVKVQGKHKKQSGGHGQFGDVWIEFEPTQEDFVFEEKIFGGAVPKNFFPAVEKGLRDSIQKGTLAGYPVVGIKATLVDGSYHPVDSSEMAFKTAASIAFRDGMAQAAPKILEPVGTLKVLLPDDYMGDVIGDITKRRGRVLGMDAADNKNKQIVAEVPMAEMADFSTALRSVTQGRADFSFEFERYEEAPLNIQQNIIEDAKE